LETTAKHQSLRCQSQRRHRFYDYRLTLRLRWQVLQVIEEYPFDASLPPESFPFLEVRILDDGPDPTRRRQIETALEGKPVRLASIKLEALQGCGDVTSDGPDDAALANLSDLDPESIMITAHRDRYGTEPDPLLLGALQEILSAENLSEPPTA